LLEMDPGVPLKAHHIDCIGLIVHDAREGIDMDVVDLDPVPWLGDGVALGLPRAMRTYFVPSRSDLPSRHTGCAASASS
jgi:hypothetical protein